MLRVRADLGRIALLLLGWALLFSYVDPRGDFPLNDDFQYVQSVSHLVAHGELRLSEWALTSSVTHVLLGSLTTLFAAPGNGALRFFALVLGGANVVLFYLFLRRLRLGAAAALLGAATLALNPVYMTMSASFHPEVSIVFFTLLALWAFTLGVETGSEFLLAAASAAAGLAFLTRQPALLLVAGGAAFLAGERRLSVRSAALLLAPAALITAVYFFWFLFLHGPTWAWLTQRPALSLSALVDPGAWLRAALRLNAGLQTLGGSLLPLALAAAPFWLKKERPRGRELAALVVVAGLAALGWAAFGGMPLLQNTFHRRGLGVVTLNAPEAKAVGAWGNTWAWRAVDAACLFSCLVLTRVFFSRWSGARTARAAVFFCAPPTLLMLFAGLFYDRYLLAFLPAAIAAALLCVGSDLRPRAGLAGCLLMAGLSTIGLKDYFAWNRARWQAGLAGIARGVPAAAIENGFDWDGQFTLARNMRRLLAESPAKEIGGWEWMRLNRIALVTSFASTPPREDFVAVERFAYRTPLSPRTEYVYLYGLKR